MTSLLDNDLDLLFATDCEDTEEVEQEPPVEEREKFDIHVSFRNAMILNPVHAIIKLEEQSREFESVIDFLFYDDHRGMQSITAAEKFRRREALSDAVCFLEWLLSPEKESSPSTITFIELIEDEGLDADIFREMTLLKLNPVFTARFKKLLKDYMEFIHE